MCRGDVMTAQEKGLEHYINNAKREIVFKLTHGEKKEINFNTILKKIKYRDANIDMYNEFMGWLKAKKVEYGYDTAKMYDNVGISIPRRLKEAVMKYKEIKNITVSGYIATLIKDDLQRVGML
jgi:hypothetical protein